MGAFARDVRYGTIPAPNRPRFSRAQWEEIACSEQSDDADYEAAIAGLFFDILLEAIRNSQAPIDSKLPAHMTVAPLAVAVANLSYCHVLRQYKQAYASGQSPLNVNEQLALVQPPELNQPAALNELLSALGDGLKVLLTKYPPKKDGDSCDLAATPGEDQICAISSALARALDYHVVSEHYNECRGGTFLLRSSDSGPQLVAVDDLAECFRIVTGYRRVLMATHEREHFARCWGELSHDEKSQLFQFTPVQHMLFRGSEIVRIELGMSETALEAGMRAAHAGLVFLLGPDREFLYEQLSDFGGVVLFDLVRAWQLLQCVSEAIFVRLIDNPGKTPEDVMAACVMMGDNVLVPALARSLGVDESMAKRLLDVLTFSPKDGQLWTQPLVRCGDRYCLALACVRAAAPVRILERWIQKGGLNLDDRGPAFERFARRKLASALERSPLRNVCRILDGRLKLSDDTELDIVIVLHGVILLLEAKAFLWHEDAIEFADYREKVEEAAAQAAKQVDVCTSDKPRLIHALRERGLTVPDDARVTGGVLLNGCSLSGMPVNGVPIIDLALLEDFLRGECELAGAEGRAETARISLYESPTSAANDLQKILSEPPQLLLLWHAAERREITIRLAPGDMGKFTYGTFQINSNRLRPDLECPELVEERSTK